MMVALTTQLQNQNLSTIPLHVTVRYSFLVIRFYGEQVVKACVEYGAHHIDISGEPYFLEKMQLVYHAEAEKKGV